MPRASCILVAAILAAAPPASDEGPAALAAAQSPAAPAELNDETYSLWRDLIQPSKKELGFEEVPWRSTFWEAVVEAQAKEMPILIWAMNGHPLACT